MDRGSDFSKMLPKLKPELTILFEDLVSRYDEGAEYAMVNAESRDEEEVMKELEREEFRDGITRLMYGSYETAMAQHDKLAEATNIFMDFLYILQEKAKGFAPIGDSFKLPSKEVLADRLKKTREIAIKQYKRVFNSDIEGIKVD